MLLLNAYIPVLDVIPVGVEKTMRVSRRHELPLPETQKSRHGRFVSPLYYHGLSAQIKMAIDRFHGIDDDLAGTDKKAMLLMTAASTFLLRMDWFIKAISTAMKRMQKAAQDLLL